MIKLCALRRPTTVVVMAPRWRRHALGKMRPPVMVRRRHRRGCRTTGMVEAMEGPAVGRVIHGMGGKSGAMALGGRGTGDLGGKTGTGALARPRRLGGGSD